MVGGPSGPRAWSAAAAAGGEGGEGGEENTGEEREERRAGGADGRGHGRKPKWSQRRVAKRGNGRRRVLNGLKNTRRRLNM
jgi:hypothetical protein